MTQLGVDRDVSARPMRLSVPAHASSKTAFPPLGLEYVAAALGPYAEKIELVNFRHQRTPGTQPFLRPETDLVCYSINWPAEFQLIRPTSTLPPGITTILGGRTATENPRYWLEACPNADAVVCGDGEQAIAEIAAGRPGRDRRAGLPRRRWPVGVQSAAAQRPAGRRPDAGAELRRRPYYLTSKGVSTGIKLDQIAGSRGCPFNCKFCSFSLNPWGVKRRWTARSPASIVREIGQIDADLIMFVDDVFTHQPERVVDILRLADGQRNPQKLHCQRQTGDCRSARRLRKMEQAGFLALLIGVESTQDATLKSMGKGFTMGGSAEAFQVFRKSKMVINAYFIVGNIGETEEQMASTALFARSLGVD